MAGVASPTHVHLMDLYDLRECKRVETTGASRAAIPGIGRHHRRENPSLADQRVVLGVCTNPDPQYAIFHIHAQGSIAESDANGPIPTDLLEVERRMLGVRLQQREVLVRKQPNIRRKGLVSPPEVSGRVMGQSRRDRPARCSAIAASASESNAPALTSCSTCSSHTWASNARNHRRNLESSAADSASTSCSSFSMLVISQYTRNLVVG